MFGNVPRTVTNIKARWGEKYIYKSNDECRSSSSSSGSCLDIIPPNEFFETKKEKKQFTKCKQYFQTSLQCTIGSHGLPQKYRVMQRWF